MNGAGDGGNKRVGITRGAHKQTASPSFLVRRLIDRHGRGGDDVFVIDVRHDGDDAPGLLADADELHHRVGPAEIAIERLLPGKEFLGHALADDHDAFGAFAVGVSKIAALDNGHAEGFEESGRYGTEACAQITLTVLSGCTIHGKDEIDVQCPGIAPGNAEAGRHVLDSG